jgi:tRNA A22 N-methylase
MKDAVNLRLYLTKELKYGISTDKIIFSDGKYYVIIKAQCGQAENLTKEQLLYGKTNLIEKSADFIDYLKKEKKRLLSVSEKIRSGGGSLFPEISEQIENIDRLSQ